MASRLPAQGMNRAGVLLGETRADPVEQRVGGLGYDCATSEFAIFVSAGVQPGMHTQMGWEVDEIEATVRELRVGSEVPGV